MTTMTERVEAGAALLDKRLGTRTWDKRIDLDALNLGSSCNCVLGQLYDGEADGESGYVHGQRVLGIDGFGPAGPAEHGFTVPGFGSSAATWGALTRTWRQLIRERIAARKRS